MDSNAALLRALPLHGTARALAVGAVGCGAGQRCRLWAVRGHRVYGVDTDPDRIAQARRLAAGLDPAIVFDLARAQALPWPSRSMDLCLVHGSLLSARDWPACLAELARVLRPGGALMLHTGSWDDGSGAMARLGLASGRDSPLAFKHAAN
ncbi:MAG: class I SAM-dependent methyltransferase [Pseudomonadota bacterium]